MARPGFLDRLTGEHTSDRDELARVLRNLQAVLNTQAGYGFFVRGFGLGEYTEQRGTKDLVESLTQEIQREIEHHEPRLSNVDVELRARDGGLWLHFTVKASLRGAPVELRLFFDTVSGEVRLQRAD